MQADDLLRRLETRPFVPFRIRLSDGTVLPIRQPEALKVGHSEAFVVTTFGRTRGGRQIAEDWRRIALADMIELREFGDEQMRAQDLLKRLEDEPFRPFRIHLDDGTVLTVKQPEMFIVGFSEAVVATKFGRSPQGRKFAKDWRTIAFNHVTELSDATARRNGKRAKSR